MGNQFGFKPKLGTDMCIYSLKEIIGSHSQLNGCVFSCFLDASKAFDRVKHSILFTKLLRHGAFGYIVRLLMFWYAHQTMCVRWGGSVRNYSVKDFSFPSLEMNGESIKDQGAICEISW